MEVYNISPTDAIIHSLSYLFQSFPSSLSPYLVSCISFLFISSLPFKLLPQLLPTPPRAICIIVRWCIRMCCRLTTIEYSLSHLLKVRGALQAPVSLLLLSADSKWASWHAQTPLIYSTNSNAQIILTLCCKKKKKNEKVKGGWKREGGEGLEKQKQPSILTAQD